VTLTLPRFRTAWTRWPTAFSSPGSIRKVADTFYVPLGDDRWLATKHTTGPWDPAAQHGGPPSALLGRAMQQCEPRADMIVARFTSEILGAVPVGEMEVRARVARPGRSVELVEATASAGGRDVIKASAWRVLRTTSDSIPADQPEPPALPPAATDLSVPGWVDGYLSAIEWRMVRGGFGQPGPAIAWSRMRYPLVPDEEPSSLERVLAVADSGNGLSGMLDITGWYYINPELTVHLHREAAGEWICIDAQTTVSAQGAGLATTTLYDGHGTIGVGAQSLLIKAR
jgi:Thioesterase-like superfamily